MSSPASLPAVVAFTRVAHHGSFTKAATELAVSPSALSQTIRTLESDLGVRLLNRTTRRVGLTEHGARFLERARIGLEHIEAAFNDLDAVRDRPTGRLRINLPKVAIEQIVLPRLPAFMARYPDVQVELFLDPTMADLIAGGFDAGIRLGECLARDMIALPVGPLQRQVVVAAPEYFQHHRPPQTPRDLVDHDCIRHRLGNGRLMPWEFTRDGRDFEVEVEGRLVFNDSGIALKAALAGQGMAQCFESQAMSEITSGRLLRVLDDWQQPFPGFYIDYPAREQMATKLRVFIDFLRENIAGT
jgi:DNA-binding transcriptional LysR family regulator